MSQPVDLTDPECEPSGEQLQALATRAFAGVRAARQTSLERLRAEIALRREAVLRALRAEPATEKAGEP